MNTQTGFKVEDYNLRVRNGRHIRVATMVTLPSGEVVRFLERMGKREAIAQAEASLTDAAELEAYPVLDDRNPASVVGVPWNENGYVS